MNGVRAYNMSINELVRNNSNQNEIGDKMPVSSDNARAYKVVKETLSETPKKTEAVSIDVSPVWQEVAGTIDLKNATADEVAKMSATLFKAEVITFEDHVSLSFAKNPDNQEKMNFLDHWNDRQEEAVLQGASHDDLNDIIRIQSILGFVDNLKD
ncbi:hypothetical protein [Pseudemcibacter aquimaris]|uniref:hypothetical protein n=1 Tax=Pseudemcibacter aquimaris TaxID=2857064 RepID=UPI00201250A9|nr:hypothetical protein [Pseudemcibacter aquimaris]MCC3861313.1 hypothetical protein [Pseudemcibacter aquimaris]WDU58086.1 hypothetical protein KW060_12885 [Pseudemcibacter aquimaris]